MKSKKSNFKPTRKMPFRRRRDGKTNYSKRLTLLKSRKPRLVVRKSLKYIRAQLVSYEATGDKTIASSISSDLKKIGWKFACDNIPAAYLTGLMIGKKAKEKKITEVILDSGLYDSTKGSRIYAVLKGAIDSGLEIPHDPSMFPSEDRITGTHISESNEKFKDLPSEFDKIKQKIMA